MLLCWSYPTGCQRRAGLQALRRRIRLGQSRSRRVRCLPGTDGFFSCLQCLFPRLPRRAVCSVLPLPLCLPLADFVLLLVPPLPPVVGNVDSSPDPPAVLAVFCVTQPGKFAVNGSMSSCFDCPPGTFQDQSGQVRCCLCSVAVLLLCVCLLCCFALAEP